MPINPLLIALGASLIGSLLDQNRRRDIELISTMTPEQQAIASQLAQILRSNLGRELESYRGALTPPVPRSLERAQATVADLLGAGFNFGALPTLQQPELARSALTGILSDFRLGAAPALSLGEAQQAVRGVTGGLNLGAMPTFQPTPFASQTLQPTLERLLSGQPVFQVDTAATQRALEAAQAPVLRQLREELLPATREQFVGGGAFWSRARAEAEAREAGRVAETLAAQRAQGALQDIAAQRQAALAGAQLAAQVAPTAASFALQSAMQPFQAAMAAREQAFREALGSRQLQLSAAQALAGMQQQEFESTLAARGQSLQAQLAASQALSEMARQQFEAEMAGRRQAFQEALSEQQTRLSAAQALASMAAQQFGMEDVALQRAYQEWLRTRPEASPYLQLAFQFLGIPMLAAYQPAAQISPWAQAAGLFGNLTSAWIQAGMPSLSTLLMAA